MSLLMQFSSEKAADIARQAFEKQFKNDPTLDREYDSRRKRFMFQDILYNLQYLDIAMEFEDDKIFTDYAIWIYQLLCHLMKDISKDRIKDQMILHYDILKEVYTENFPEQEAQKACHHLENAISATINEALNIDTISYSSKNEYENIKNEYLELLLKSDTKAALQKIDTTSKSGIPLENIYMDVLQQTMVDVGNLWHTNQITVDREHYCTTATQMAMSQFYPQIFSKSRIGYKLLACCVGSELHEMGIRMVSDLFEFNGWDSIYLGAAVPKEALLHAIAENKPDLVALSVTMPLHLPICYDMVTSIRKIHKDIKIAVGGRAFFSTQQLWKKWDVDIFTENAVQLVEWAEENIVKVGGSRS